MVSKHFYSPKAEKDLNEIAHYILEDNLESALRFIDAVEKTCTELAQMPHMGRTFAVRNPALKEMRFIRVNKVFFSYLIFYWQTKKGIEIIRILHGARDLPALFGK